MRGTARIMALLTIGLLVVGAVLWAAEDGKALFESKCAICHGKDGTAKPMAKGSSNLNEAKWQDANPAAGIEKVTTEGKGTMKGYKDKLTPDQIKAIAEYVKTLKK